MNKIVLIGVFAALLLTGCSEADRLAWSKNNTARNVGLDRRITVYSSLTGQVLLVKELKHGNFENSNAYGSVDMDVLDLKTQLRTSIIAQNAVILIEELPSQGMTP